MMKNQPIPQSSSFFGPKIFPWKFKKYNTVLHQFWQHLGLKLYQKALFHAWNIKKGLISSVVSNGDWKFLVPPIENLEKKPGMNT